MSAQTSQHSLATLTQGLFRSHRPRTGQWVHRSSYHAGEREGRRWAQCNMFAASEHNARMAAAEKFEHDTKEPGKRNGALGHIGLEILRFMLRLRNRKTGRLDPSLTWLAWQLRRARSAVAAAMARLKHHGFIDWDRRTRPVDEPGRDGQYVEQISNAYFFTLPKLVAEKVRQILRRPTEAMRRAERERRHDAELVSRTPQEAIAAVTDPDLKAVLSSIGRAFQSANPLKGLNGPFEIQE